MDEEYIVIETLGGSSRPKRVKFENHDDEFVIKSGNDSHLREEVLADSIYEFIGIPVARSAMYDKGMKISEYISNGTLLSDIDLETFEKISNKISNHFVVDALIANWDVFGLDLDNILITDNTPYRIDNGGSLRYRALGSPKGKLFGPIVGELESMRDEYINFTSAKVLKNLTDEDIREQIIYLHDNMKGAIENIKDKDLQNLLFKRLEYMKNW